MSDESKIVSVETSIGEGVWEAVEKFRENSECGEVKVMGLMLVFWKVISDRWDESEERYRQRFGDDREWIERRLSREPFLIPPDCGFRSLWQHRNECDLGERLNVAFEQIEAANRRKLDGVFGVVDFADERLLGVGRRRNRRLRCLFEALNEPGLSFRSYEFGVLGAVSQFLVERYGANAGANERRVQTPPSIAKLLAALFDPQGGTSVCDPFCGAGSVLGEVARRAGKKRIRVYGQESDPLARAVCRVNLCITGLDSIRIELGDSIREPRLVEEEDLIVFDTVLSHPTAAAGDWGYAEAATDRFQRFGGGLPPRSRGDYGRVLHMLHIAREGSGRVGICLPHGVLFRGGQEYRIRRSLLEENLVEAVIGLPSNLLPRRKTPLVVLLFHRGKESSDVLFVDASRDFTVGRRRNELADSHIERIVETYRNFASRPGYAQRATMREIVNRDYSLDLADYVVPNDNEDTVDLDDLGREIMRLEGELATIRSRIEICFGELRGG